ncbi:Asp-tRNA(Asn)/Glu-tRNA(Gln) amidotransferase subunit GatA [Candidatus Epulonipiscium viviparus]|uniref:Asp-tRNA(Asn)/Glu-tRNA(Gln) amidotransferase subunit GatA n=1 Tax=Candidatus Epulonipiscium viviparus TaxID=420336 RepID=UPI00273809A7|nr:Asp-tRNA(Asn)/Glu-tRNA(Gln) amidotransferase subunit GatA [Candidatus Epulopiscium viviparus]
MYTVSELSKMLKDKKISSVEVTTEYLAKIDAKDKEIEAFLLVTKEEAMEAAKLADATIAAGNATTLTGIPCAIKDNMCTKGIRTTCGSKMLEDFIPEYDAFVIKKLKVAETVMLGKLNMDEFAMGSSNENSHFHITKNPKNLERVPGGSSGGSAAAVAADMAVFTLGSDTGGSIRQPASFCGVVGMKPTYGSISRNGLVAFASSFDQIGPLTHTVKDSAMVLNAIVGHDKGDSTSRVYKYEDYTKDLEKGVRGLKLAVPKEYLEGDAIQAEVKEAIVAAIKEYEKMGAVVKKVSMPSLKLALPAYYVISSAEASSNLSRFDGVRYGYRTDDYENIEDLYKKSRSEGFGAEVKRRIMLGTFALSAGYYDAYYKKAVEVRALIKQEFDEVFKDSSAIISPVAPTTAYKLGQKTKNPLEMYMGDIYSVPVNIAGVPAISIPCGVDLEELPIGMQLIGNMFSEALLYQIANAYEAR